MIFTDDTSIDNHDEPSFSESRRAQSAWRMASGLVLVGLFVFVIELLIYRFHSLLFIKMNVMQVEHQFFEPLGVKIEVSLEIPDGRNVFFHLVKDVFHNASQVLIINFIGFVGLLCQVLAWRIAHGKFSLEFIGL
jgi:hypothetical protein